MCRARHATPFAAVLLMPARVSGAYYLCCCTAAKKEGESPCRCSRSCATRRHCQHRRRSDTDSCALACACVIVAASHQQRRWGDRCRDSSINATSPSLAAPPCRLLSLMSVRLHKRSINSRCCRSAAQQEGRSPCRRSRSCASASRAFTPFVSAVKAGAAIKRAKCAGRVM